MSDVVSFATTSVTTALACNGGELVGLEAPIMEATTTALALEELAADGTTWLPVTTADGTAVEFAVSATAARRVLIPLGDYPALRKIRFKAVDAAHAVVTQDDQEIVVRLF